MRRPRSWRAVHYHLHASLKNSGDRGAEGSSASTARTQRRDRARERTTLAHGCAMARGVSRSEPDLHVEAACGAIVHNGQREINSPACTLSVVVFANSGCSASCLNALYTNDPRYQPSRNL